MQDVSKAFNSFNCKVVRPPLNWRVTVVSLSLCSGLVDYTCSYLISFCLVSLSIYYYSTLNTAFWKEIQFYCIFSCVCHDFNGNFSNDRVQKS